MGTHFRNSAIMKVIFPLLLIVLASMHVSNGQVSFVRDPATWSLTPGGRLDLDCTSNADFCSLKCPAARNLDVKRKTSTRIDLGCYLHPTLYPAAGIPQEAHLMMNKGWQIDATKTIKKVNSCGDADQCFLPCAAKLTSNTKNDGKMITTEIRCE